MSETTEQKLAAAVKLSTLAMEDIYSLKKTVAQLTKENEELKKLLDNYDEFTYSAISATSVDGPVDYDYLTEIALDLDLIKFRNPTKEELADPNWFGHEYEYGENDRIWEMIYKPAPLNSQNKGAA